MKELVGQPASQIDLSYRAKLEQKNLISVLEDKTERIRPNLSQLCISEIRSKTFMNQQKV